MIVPDASVDRREARPIGYSGSVPSPRAFCLCLRWCDASRADDRRFFLTSSLPFQLHAARAYSSRLQGSGLLEGGSSPEIDELVADGESMKLILR